MTSKTLDYSQLGEEGKIKKKVYMYSEYFFE